MLGVKIKARASHSHKTPQNDSQNWSSRLLDHFVVIKRQRQSFCPSREAFHDYSHMRICCLIGVQHARCEDNSVSIIFPTKH